MSLATGCLVGTASTGRKTGAVVGQFAVPPACTVPHHTQNLGGSCLAANSGFCSSSGNALGGTATGNLGTGATRVIGFSEGTVAGLSTEIGAAGFSGMGDDRGDAAWGDSFRKSGAVCAT